MTHDILRSDIDLATRLKDGHRPDDEIILALVHRGVDAGKAAQLVGDLSKGIRPNPHSPLPVELSMARRSRARGVPPGNGQTPPSRSSRATSRDGSSSQSPDQGQPRSPAFWLTVAICVGLVITAGSLILIQRIKASHNALEEQKPKAAMPKVNETPSAAPPKAAAPSTNVPPLALILELRPGGLHLGGSLITGGNVLAAVGNLLGVPTRTNQVGQTGTVIYAYDRHGLLIYSQKVGGTNSIVLDCEGSGGNNGTTFPFTGALKIEDQAIGSGTDAQALAAIRKLELNHFATGDSVLGGHYSGLDLVFAYLKSPQHLSLIEIDLK